MKKIKADNPFIDVDVRQSQAWAEYLKYLDWKVAEVDGIHFATYKYAGISFTKLQRPTSLNKEQLEEIINVSKTHGSTILKVEPNVNQDVSMWEELKFKSSVTPLLPTKTMLIDLKESQENLWAKISKSFKYSINRGYREGTKLVCIANPKKEDLVKFHEILKETATSKKLQIEPLEQLITLCNIFKNNVYLTMTYSKENKQPTAGCLLIANQSNVWIMHGATSDFGRKTKDGYVLYWETILYLKKLGYKYLDLEGLLDERIQNTTKNWGGFSHFKERLGGEVIYYPLPYIKYKSKLLNFLADKVPTAM
ncbi:MAG: peptidoglycan bridge formation glycyltransferase FemA/FemB family protein [Patescibacteria group bacterium]|uniref:Peptidoglycan bridge formation glycyltransferase FemA/FemB family protein n=1 Tax=candidate division WWE3 bacterium TaxID=2053526 RepID=A0A955EC75_UNCKA|nr:peptidoglycan bridge formation glycyltransferase FemA/FemB family protein [candidate division WWE3 bacterium]